jgi:predicted nucleic acid-binding protein
MNLRISTRRPRCGRGSHRFRLGLRYCNTDDATAAALDDGERAAIALAVAIGAELILMDDRAGVAVAYQKGLTVTGTLGVLDLAARRGLIDLAVAIGRPKATNFRCRAEIMDALLAHQSERQK